MSRLFMMSAMQTSEIVRHQQMNDVWYKFNDEYDASLKYIKKRVITGTEPRWAHTICAWLGR